MNSGMLLSALQVVSLIGLGYLILKDRARERAASLATAERALHERETEARLAETTSDLERQTQDLVEEASKVQGFELLGVAEGKAVTLLAKAVATGVTDWRVLATKFGEFHGIVASRRQALVGEALALTKAAEDLLKGTERDTLFGLLRAQAEQAGEGLAHCSTVEEGKALQEKIRWLLSQGGASDPLELETLVAAEARFAALLASWRESQEKDHADRQERSQESMLSKLLGTGRWVEALALLQGQWLRKPADPTLFSQYLSEVANAAKALPVEEATHVLLEAETSLKNFRVAARPEDLLQAVAFQATLSEAKRELQGSIVRQRGEAFGTILAALPGLAERGLATTSRDELPMLKKEADALAGTWGYLNPAESEAWAMEHGKLMRVLIERDRTLADEEAAVSGERASQAAVRLAEELGRTLAAAVQDAGKAKTTHELALIVDRVGDLRQPDLAPLPLDQQELLASRTRDVQKAIHLAEERIVHEARTAYNQRAVQEIDALHGRLTLESNQKPAQTSSLAGTFAAIDPALLEPALQQYYQLAVAKVIEVLGEEATRNFMGHLSGASKTGLEG